MDPGLLRWYAIKLFERDEKVQQQLALPADLARHIDQHIADCEKELDDDAESIITNQRYTYIAGVVAKSVSKKRAVHSLTTSDKIDRVVTNRIAALPIFALVMAAVYAIAMGDTPISIGTMATDWTNEVLFTKIVPPAVEGFLTSIGCADWLLSLINDGIVAGVGAVLGFVPQMLVLFFLLSILEDVGYMARIAFIMDRIFRKFGLSGKSFIPMLVGTGCGVPGVMASRTIENDRDRKMTIMTTCFIPCGAKMPIIGLFAGAIFGGSTLVAVSAYFIGVAAIIVSGIILKKTKMFAGDPAPFVMELPAYHIPAWGNVLRATWERGWSFIKRAGTVILASTVVLWFLQGFGFTDGAFGMVEDNNNSLLAAIGGAVSFIFAPLGFGFWQATVGHRHRPDRQGKRRRHAWPAVRLRRRDLGKRRGDLGHDSHLLHRPDGLQLYDLQPAVRPLLCGHGRHQAGDEQPQVDHLRHRVYVRVCLLRVADGLPVRRPDHRRGQLWHWHCGGAGRAGRHALPAAAQEPL